MKVRELERRSQTTPTMITVEAATVRFESISGRETKTTKSRERVETKPRAGVTRSWQLTRTKSPAMTRVQEWRRLETGVGPSIASGSQR